jgi:hypothetical protein
MLAQLADIDGARLRTPRMLDGKRRIERNFEFALIPNAGAGMPASSR